MQSESHYHQLPANIEPKKSILKDHSTVPKILLVEDNALIQQVETAFLDALGCQVEVASNGQQAIDLANNNPDLIFMDIGLPDIDGVTVTSTIRKGEKTQRVPIVAITAEQNLSHEKCIEAGLDEITSKPISQERLKKILLRWLPSHLTAHLQK